MTQQAIHFPFSCGNAIVHEDRITVKKGLTGQTSLDITFENIRTIRQMGSHYHILTNDGGFYSIRSPKRSHKEYLLEIWWNRIESLLKSQGYLSGEIRDVGLTDKISIGAYPAICFLLIWWFFLRKIPFSTLRYWDRPQIAVFATLSVGLLLFFSVPLIMSLRILLKKHAWRGAWRINTDGFWHGANSKALTKLTPTSEDEFTLNAITFPYLRYGGRRIPLEFLGYGSLLRDLFALHLRKAGVQLAVDRLWPGILRSLFIPLPMLGWYALGKWSGLALRDQDWMVILLVGLFFWCFWIAIQLHYGRIAMREYEGMTKRLDALEKSL